MPAFFISALFGAFQVFLLKFITSNLTAGKKGIAFLLIAVKFITYAVAIYLLMQKYFSYLSYCAFGFIVGEPLFALVLFAIYTLRKKER